VFPGESNADTPAPRAGAGLIGDGSSFAGPEILQWTTDVAKTPYNLSLNYTSDSSGQGRFDFGSGTVDFAVSDIPYQSPVFDTKQPSFPFIYVPVTAGGLAFMYHIDGLSSSTKLQLSSYSICALMTGAVKTWNDPIIQADNPGVTLPSTPVRPVIRSDLAGTNFVLQEYCIHEQPALWKAFVTAPSTVSYPNQVTDLSPTEPRSDWPFFPSAIVTSGSSSAADDVADPKDDGYITAVETAYAIQRSFPVASVKNASGDYTQPTAVGVASALAYATQNSDGTHNLNFGGTGPYVYNPSTYSYLLSPTTGWSASKGNTMSQFVNYALTLGQQKAPEIGYASLGLSLEQYGVNAVKANVPGAVPLLASEQSAYACGDLTVAEVQAGQQQPTCGVTNPNTSTSVGTATTAPGAAKGSGTSRTTTPASTKEKGVTSTSTGTGVGPTATGGPDAGVSLTTPSGPLPVTGDSPLPIVIPGVLFVVTGFLVRRRQTARMR
jgi:ABC-type phosphate transport system substrate-binding protein